MTIVASNSLTLSNVNDGTITHIAYAYSADGADRFTLNYPNLNQLNGSRIYSKSNPYVLTGNSVDTYVHLRDVTANLKAGTYTLSAKTDGVWVNHRSTNNPNDKGACLWLVSSENDINISLGNTVPQTINVPKDGTYCIRVNLYSDGTTNVSRKFWDFKLDSGSIATPYMPSSSEVTTADWPSYIGQYTDFTQADSTNPSNYTWSLIRGNDGKDGANGKDGIAGKDGVGIKTTVITYAISTSGTAAPTTGWTSSVPGLVKGQYLWTKTVWTYTDNSSETGYSVSYISKDGNNGTDGLAGKDGVGIKTTAITYASHTNGTTAPTTGYTATVPSVPAGQFLWTKTIWTYTDNSTETGYSVAMMGLKGDQGIQGIQGRDGIAGKDGKGINLTTITYSISTSGTTAPTTGYTSTVPTLVKGQYLWTKTVWRYTDNSTETGYSVAYIAQDGNNGNDGIAGKDGTGIKTTTITYAGSTSGTTAPTSGWTSTVPTVAAGSYLWTKTVWAYTDNTSETGYSVAKMGNDGATGPQGPQGNIGPQGHAGSNGDPGKIVSDTEPSTRFKGLTWKYSGTADLTASEGTVIHPNTEYYYNGTNWMINYLSANNLEANSITADLIDAKNLTITDGEFVSTIINGSVKTQTEIKDDHLLIYKMDTSTNSINTIAIKSDSGLAMTYQNSDTGEYTSAGVNFQGLFMQNNITNEFARLTPQGTKLSTDVPWTKLSLMNNFTGNIEYAIINGTVYISASGVGVPAMTAGQWKQAAQLPTGSSAIPIRANRITAGDSGDGLSWALLSNQAGGLFIRCSANKAATANLFNATLPYPIG